MPKAEQKATSFEQELHLMISDEMSQKGDMSFQLKVMSWIIDGRKGKPQLTKQQMSINENGQTRGGKSKGLTLMDLDKVLERLPEVYKALGGNPAMLEKLLADKASPAEAEPF